jgi:hypothetical protein
MALIALLVLLCVVVDKATSPNDVLESRLHAQVQAQWSAVHKMIMAGKIAPEHLNEFYAAGAEKPKVQVGDPTVCVQAYVNELGTALQAPQCSTLFSSLGGITGNQANDAIDAFCTNPCYPTYIEALRRYLTCLGYDSTYYGAANAYASITAWFDFLCTKNPVNGQYCLANWYNPLITGRSTSFSACYFYGFDYGCCLSSLINYYSAATASYYTGWNSYLTTCGLTLLPACPRPGVTTRYVSVSWALRGVLYSWVSDAANPNNNIYYRYYLRAVIARHFGVNAAYVAVVTLRSGSIIADFQIRGANNTQTDALTPNALAQAKVTPVLTELINGIGTNGTDGGAYSIDESRTTVAQASVTPVYGASGSGNFVAPSFFILLASIFVAIKARNLV